MFTRTTKTDHRRRGQGMTEYIIIVAVVAVLSIGIVVKFGDSIRQLFNISTDVMSGSEQGVTIEGKADSSSDKALSDLGVTE